MSRAKPVQYEINENGCHICTSHAPHSGYPTFERNGIRQSLHRFTYEKTNGTIPKGMVVRHKCDNTMCINPEHLEIGTPKDNVHDMMTRGRFVPRKSAFTDTQIQEIIHSSGSNASIGRLYGTSGQHVGRLKKKYLPSQ